jgi:EAL domain-containing protein (putative c-di-GMP-specific phosphodiesterase class I)
MSGVEALVRWQHPTRGMVPPNNFISMAEDCGLIDALGEWVLRRACAQYRVWCEARVAPPSIAVNVSTRQLLEANFAERVATIVREVDIAPQSLELEITEGLLMQDAPQVAANLQRLRVLGVRFALDDFGTGFSSLAYLKRLPIDVLKIDRFFIRDVATNADAQAIVNGILAMAGALDKQVVAEGVETEAQMVFLRAQNCHLMQGYYFHRPMPAEELTTILRRDGSDDPRVVRFVPRA